jgi:glycosyltransferase involved in cell wall biosynthesis
MQSPEVRRPLRRILIAGKDQFGHLTDSYQHAFYLRDCFDVTFFGRESGLAPLALDGVRIRHYAPSSNKIISYLKFLLNVLREIRSGEYDLVYISYFEGAGIFPLLVHGPIFILDIRTGYVRKSNFLRVIFNAVLTLESLAYKHVTIISESLRTMLHIGATKGHVLPLGAAVPTIAPKQFDTMRLFYVGSLEQRHIDRTVEGFARFYREGGKEIDATYDIVGFGLPGDEMTLRKAIAASGCPDAITFHGRVPYTQLQPYLERSNIGVAFIPKVPYYDCQPPTKLFEYLLAGMPVLATTTSENVRVVAEHAGVLIDDTAESVYQGLLTLRKNLPLFNSQAIRATVEDYVWERIVTHNLKPYLLSILDPQSSSRPGRGR